MLGARNVALVLAVAAIAWAAGRFGKSPASPPHSPDHHYETAIVLPEWCLDGVIALARKLEESGHPGLNIYPVDISDNWDPAVKALAVVGGRSSDLKTRDEISAAVLSLCSGNRARFNGFASLEMFFYELKEILKDSRTDYTFVVRLSGDSIELISPPEDSKNGGTRRAADR